MKKVFRILTVGILIAAIILTAIQASAAGTENKLAAPVFTLTNTDSGLSVKWTAVKDETVQQYTVLYRVQGQSGWKKISGIKKAGYTITGLKMGVSYNVAVVCADKDGKIVSEKKIKTIRFTAPLSLLKPLDTTKGVKILIIGNSDVRCNDLGGQLAAVCKAEGKKAVVVQACRDGRGPKRLTTEKLAAYWWDGRKNTVKANGEGVYNHKYYLKDVLDKDWGNMKRGGKWDYIVFLNDACQEGGRKNIVAGDTLMFKFVKSYLPSARNFIVVSYHHNNTTASDIHPEHKKAAEKNGFSVIVTAALFPEVDQDWTKSFTVRDRYWHPSARAQYFNACAIYSRIYGKSALASSESASKFIKVFNSNGGKATSYYPKMSAPGSFIGNKQADGVDMKSAKKIQSVIYKNYDKYVMWA